MGVLRNIAVALASALSAIWRTTGDVLKGFRNDVARLLGRGGESMPAAYVPETSVNDVLDEFRDRHAREMATDHAHVGDVGRAVHQYAAAEGPDVRCAVDLSPLSPTQTDWLLGLRDGDLARLTKAGPRACELAARGKRSGLVGLPMPDDRPSGQGVIRAEDRGDLILRPGPAFA